MYKAGRDTTSSLRINQGYKGETIEAKVRRILNNKEPITDGAPLIYTERKDGIQPDHNIRADKWEHAIDAMDKVSKDRLKKRQDRNKPKEDADEIARKAKEGMKAEGQSPVNTSDN